MRLARPPGRDAECILEDGVARPGSCTQGRTEPALASPQPTQDFHKALPRPLEEDSPCGPLASISSARPRAAWLLPAEVGCSNSMRNSNRCFNIWKMQKNQRKESRDPPTPETSHPPMGLPFGLHRGYKMLSRACSGGRGRSSGKSSGRGHVVRCHWFLGSRKF